MQSSFQAPREPRVSQQPQPQRASSSSVRRGRSETPPNSLYFNNISNTSSSNNTSTSSSASLPTTTAAPDWRKPGMRLRRQLLEQDEQSSTLVGTNTISNDCPLAKYLQVSQRVVHEQFLHHPVDTHEELLQAYTIGQRLVTFWTVLLPQHKDYHTSSTSTASNNKSVHQQLQPLLQIVDQYLEQMALLIDQQVYQDYIGQVLLEGVVNAQVDNEDDKNHHDMTTTNQSLNNTTLTTTATDLFLSNHNHATTASNTTSTMNNNNNNHVLQQQQQHEQDQAALERLEEEMEQQPSHSLLVSRRKSPPHTTATTDTNNSTMTTPLKTNVASAAVVVTPEDPSQQQQHEPTPRTTNQQQQPYTAFSKRPSPRPQEPHYLVDSSDYELEDQDESTLDLSLTSSLFQQLQTVTNHSRISNDSRNKSNDHDDDSISLTSSLFRQDLIRSSETTSNNNNKKKNHLHHSRKVNNQRIQQRQRQQTRTTKNSSYTTNSTESATSSSRRSSSNNHNLDDSFLYNARPTKSNIDLLEQESPSRTAHSTSRVSMAAASISPSPSGKFHESIQDDNNNNKDMPLRIESRFTGYGKLSHTVDLWKNEDNDDDQGQLLEHGRTRHFRNCVRCLLE